MKSFLLALTFVFACASHAQKQLPDWQPSPGHTEVDLWPGTPPDAQPVPGLEKTEISAPNDLVAGKQVVSIYNVTRPTLTVYSPTGHNTGAAVVVFPGGAIPFWPSTSKARKCATGSQPKALHACC